jgi:hypothetical protein
MSCFMVSDEHLCLLVQAGRDMTRQKRHGNMSWYWKRHPEDSTMQRSELDTLQESADRVVRLLWQENCQSVAFRYADSSHLEEMLPDDAPSYRQAIDASMMQPVWIMKAIQCYRYQSCEHPGWEQSEAFAYCAALEQAMIHALPGYDDAPTWEYTKEGYKRWTDAKRAEAHQGEERLRARIAKAG